MASNSNASPTNARARAIAQGLIRHGTIIAGSGSSSSFVSRPQARLEQPPASTSTPKSGPAPVAQRPFVDKSSTSSVTPSTQPVAPTTAASTSRSQSRPIAPLPKRVPVPVSPASNSSPANHPFGTPPRQPLPPPRTTSKLIYEESPPPDQPPMPASPQASETTSASRTPSRESTPMSQKTTKTPVRTVQHTVSKESSEPDNADDLQAADEDSSENEISSEDEEIDPGSISRNVAGSSGSSGTESGIGLSHPKISLGRRQMLDLVNRLHSTGVQVDIDLPQIAVIGSQSAGKSSLIESISGITLPRATGTCTRCPIECRLARRNAPWQCIVSLRFTTDKRGQVLGQARNRSFGGIIYDKTLVEDRIRRAQYAILNPKKSRKHFLEVDDEELGTTESQLSFSSNCVSLQISGPDVADLSFCDLPGLIASVGSSGDKNDISLVENLVTSYIKKPSCIILLTVACETDFENQGAHRLAKQYDPEGKRTIGVLTKPDRIPIGEENSWLPFLRNEKEPLENNWFCVKQPSSNDLKSKMTWAMARSKEDEYFSTTSPWNELDSVYQRYLRTSNLVDRLSLVLSDLISRRLPQIHEELERTISKTRHALYKLPRAPSNNPQNEISSLLHNFVSDLEKHIEGVPDEDGLLQAIRPAHDRFRRAIRTTAPNFRPFEKSFEGKRHMRQAKFLVQEEGKVWEGEDSEDEEAKRGNAGWPALAQNVEASADAIRGKKRKAVSTTKIYIDDVLARANQARTRELPGHYPFIVQQTFIESIIKEWNDPAVALCKTVHGEMLEHVKKLVEKHFGNFGQGQLEQRVKTIMHRHIEDCMTSASRMIEWNLLVEARPFSLNTHYLQDYKTKFLTFYKEERQRYSRNGLAVPGAAASQTENVNEALAALAKIGLSGIKPEDLWKLLPGDEMEPALTIMADVRAYFQVAYKRFADNLPLAIDHELVRGVGRDVLKVLYDKLGINGVDGHEICKDLAQESAQVADKREDLGKRLERLEIAQKELFSL